MEKRKLKTTGHIKLPSITEFVINYDYESVKRVILAWLREDPHRELKKYGPLCPLDYQELCSKDLALKRARETLQRLISSREQ